GRAERGVRGASPESEDEPEGEGERSGDHRGAQRRAEPLDDERAPHRGGRLALGRVPQDVPAVELEDAASYGVPHGEEDADEDEGTAGDRAPQLAPARDGTGSVIEDRGHRANATFFSRRVARSPAGMVNAR